MSKFDYDPVVPIRPHLYLCVYPSGLRFWRVIRVPIRWQKMTDEEKLLNQAAINHCNKLNGELHEKPNRGDLLGGAVCLGGRS